MPNTLVHTHRSSYTNLHMCKSSYTPKYTHRLPIHTYTPTTTSLYTLIYLNTHLNIFLSHYKPSQTFPNLYRMPYTPAQTSNALLHVSKPLQTCGTPHTFPVHPFSPRFHTYVTCASFYLSELITVPILFVFYAI